MVKNLANFCWDLAPLQLFSSCNINYLIGFGPFGAFMWALIIVIGLGAQN